MESTSFTRAILSPYYLNNPNSTFFRNQRELENLNGCDPDNLIKMATGIAFAALVLIAVTLFLALCGKTYGLSTGGCATAVAVVSVFSLALSAMFVSYCISCCKDRKEFPSRKEKLNDYFNKPLMPFGLRLEVNNCLDKSKLPVDLIPYLRKES